MKMPDEIVAARLVNEIMDTNDYNRAVVLDVRVAADNLGGRSNMDAIEIDVTMRAWRDPATESVPNVSDANVVVLKLLDALGIETHNIQAVTIEAGVDHKPRITVTRAPKSANGHKLDGLTEVYAVMTGQDVEDSVRHRQRSEGAPVQGQ